MRSSGFGVRSAVPGDSSKSTKVELDRVEVNRGALGSIDSTYCTIAFSIAESDLGSAAVARVMRADLGVSPYAVPPTLRGISDLSVSSTTRKELDPIYRVAMTLSASSIGSQLSEIVRDDAVVGYRTAAGSNAFLRTDDSVLSSNRTTGTGELLSVAGIDVAVARNPAFYMNRRALGDVPAAELPREIPVGSRLPTLAAADQVKLPDQSSLDAIVERRNSYDFREISTVVLSRPRGRTIGSFIEFTVDDPSVVYGRRYVYYVSIIDPNMRSGVRSRLVQIDVVFMQTPSVPEVSYVVIDGTPRFSISSSGASKFEVYRKGGNPRVDLSVIGDRSAVVGSTKATKLPSGYVRIDDINADHSGRATFIDRDVRRGQTISYRFYSVNGFEMKCQTPFECTISLPDRSRKVILGRPSISVSLSQDAKSIDVSISLDDDRVSGFVLLRRDVTLGESAYHSPNEPGTLIMTQKDIKRRNSSIGERLVDPLVWNGRVVRTGTFTSFKDRFVQIDHIYQYCVYGVDRRGNTTDSVPSSLVGVYLKPLVDAPRDLIGQFDGSRVKLSWTYPGNDVDLMEMVNGTSESTKTVFQVERRPQGGSWESLPAVSGTEMSDEISSDRLHTKYEYRVIAIQRGGFVSPYSEPILVETSVVPVDPANLRVRTTPLSSRPVMVVVSWDYSGSDVDRWEVERAVVNKIAAAKITSLTSGEIDSLKFDRAGIVTRESSRASAASSDGQFFRDPRVFMGNRVYIDQDVSLIDSYVYRVRAISNDGSKSGWAVKGVLMVDSPFDRKLSSIMTDREKSALSQTTFPARVRSKLK